MNRTIIKNHILAIFLLFIYACFSQRNDSTQHYQLLQQVAIPAELLQKEDNHIFGGDIRIGDLQNKGEMDFIVYRSAQLVEGGAAHPVFMAAFNMAGQVLWKKGSGGTQPNRPGALAVYDIDGDGDTEVICVFAKSAKVTDPFSMQETQFMIISGNDGTIERQASLPEIQKIQGEGPNWVHQRILIANLRGEKTPQDFIIKLGKTIFALNSKLEILWSYYNPNDLYQNCPAYIPAVGDIDNDGLDEINGGYYLLDHDGTVLWERELGKNMDCVLIDFWDTDTIKRAICSGHCFVMDHLGDTILHLGAELVPHGQEIRVADFDKQHNGREMMIRYNGHQPDIHLVGQSGKLIRTFKINDSPNHTGMEAIAWDGKDQPCLLYNGGVLWTGEGQEFCRFNELKTPPVGPTRQGWYHVIAADFCGDDGEDVVVYNPWESSIYLFTANRKHWNKRKHFTAEARQYNPRLID